MTETTFISADDVTVTCPLFHEEYGGSTPTSALQLVFSRMNAKRASRINELWHSRLPKLTNWQGCFAYCAEYANVVYAVALWGNTVSFWHKDKNWIELRRLAISDNAPKNTASRMLGWMLRDIRKNTDYVRAISYQDTEVHTGTIYKASGWTVGCIGKHTTWTKGKRRQRNIEQSTAPKIRWEYDLERGRR